MPRMLYLATADARGHLMRAQLLVHALRQAGAEVDVLTTSDEGIAFLSEFGIQARLLSRHYAVQFDAQQNMLRTETNRNVAHYVFRPSRMLRDVLQLAPAMARADLVINDSFHPALLLMGTLPDWRRKVVHVYGGSLKAALTANFEGRVHRAFARLFARVVDWQIRSARCSMQHDFAHGPNEAPDLAAHVTHYLPTPVALAGDDPGAANANGVAAIYLNPHFRDPALAQALCAGLRQAGLSTHQVGEGYAGQGDWVGVDRDWVARAAHSRLIVSAPGMAALSIAHVYQRPILLILTDQPEQTANAARAAQLKLNHRVVVWRGDANDFQQQVAAAATGLAQARTTPEHAAAGRARALARIEAWTTRLLALCPPVAPPRSSR